MKFEAMNLEIHVEEAGKFFLWWGLSCEGDLCYDYWVCPLSADTVVALREGTITLEEVEASCNGQWGKFEDFRTSTIPGEGDGYT